MFDAQEAGPAVWHRRATEASGSLGTWSPRWSPAAGRILVNMHMGAPHPVSPRQPRLAAQDTGLDTGDVGLVLGNSRGLCAHTAAARRRYLCSLRLRDLGQAHA
jgi:hypothetical protein